MRSKKRIEYEKEYRKKNIEKIKAYHKKYNKENEDKIKEWYGKNKVKLIRYGKEYRRKNAERLNQWARDYREKNKEKIKNYRKENAEKIKIRKRNYRYKMRKSNDLFWIVDNMRIRLRRGLKNYPNIKEMKASTEYDVDYKKIIEHLNPKENLRKYVIHHIIPLACFNLDKPLQFKLATTPSNHKLMLITEHNKINHPELIRIGRKKIQKIFGEEQ
jgi:hypothetical protein